MSLGEVIMTDGVQATKGSLARARIFEVNDQREQVKDGFEVACMFNPFEYTLTKSNSYNESKATKGASAPKAEFSKGGPQTLQIALLFDTYDSGGDVRTNTNKLWEMMAVKKKENKKPDEKDSPPMVAFAWASFYFVAYITNMKQTFTLFTHEGIPVRAKVDITFTQYIDEADVLPGQNPTSGGGPINRLWRVVGGERIDLIAAQVYGDATKWRLIADHNQLVDPLALRPGQLLAIPLS